MQLPSRQVNMAWCQELELLDATVAPLPGGSVRRGALAADPRVHLARPLAGDVITFYEHVALIRHKPYGPYYVAFRETIDMLLLRQTDLEKFPEWIMKHPVKRTELRTFLMEMTLNPKRLMAELGQGELWFPRWLKEIEEDWKHEALAYFLQRNQQIRQEMFART